LIQPVAKNHQQITCLFLDVGGVILNHGWDHQARSRACEHFKLDYAEMEQRHSLCFETHESGKMTFDEYLNHVVFHDVRSFSREQFKTFMFAQSTANTEMIELITQVATRYAMKVVVVSNEARGINEHRIQKFNLDRLVDFFVSSCYVHLRKPDLEIFRLALDISHVRPDQVLFIDDTALFVEIAESIGIRGIHHQNLESTRQQLADLGLDCSNERRSSA
jgi:putative hydrolase of the HAD superfamily